MSDRLSVKAIVVGALVDVLASMVGGFIAAVAAAVIVGLQADPGADQVGAISTAFAESVPLALIGIAAGSIGSISTGWVAARIAGARHVLHGTLAASVLLPWALWSAFVSVSPLPRGLMILLVPAGPALGALGGLIAARRAGPARA